MVSRIWVFLFALAAALLAGIAILSADEQQNFNLTYTTYPLARDGQVDRSEAPSRYWYKGHRSRIDNFTSGGARPELGQSFIMDCDSSRMITIDWSNRTYTLMTFEEFQQMQEQMMRLASRFAGAIPGAGGQQGGRTGPGGTVTLTTIWRDSMLDERRFGLPVRWVSMAQTHEASADACYAGASHSQVERWITDLDLPLCVPPFDLKGMAAAAPQAPQPTCQDRIVEHKQGTPRTGFTLREWTQDGTGGVSGWEVTDLSRDSLADSLFAPPRGFERVELELPSEADMDAAASAMSGAGAPAAEVAPKVAGTIRVGVALRLPPDAPVVPAQIAADVAEWIRSNGIDAVPLRASSRDAALAEAPGVEADYVLFYDMDKAEMKASGRGMLGSAIGGALGGRAAGGAVRLEARGAYELLGVPSGERIMDGEIDEKQAAEDPQVQLVEILEPPAGEAIAAIRR